MLWEEQLLKRLEMKNIREILDEIQEKESLQSVANTFEKMQKIIDNKEEFALLLLDLDFLQEGTVLDEEKSVRWNREEVQKRNADIRKKVEDADEMMKEKERLFELLVQEYIEQMAMYYVRSKTFRWN